MNIDLETRNFAVNRVEVRAAADAPKQIHGYAAVFDQLSEDLGYFREKVAPGAFANSIAKDDIYALNQHLSYQPIGRKSARSLGLREDLIGLNVEITPPDTTWGRDALVSVESGLVSHFSFGFETIRDAWDYTDPQAPIRTLLEVRLWEVSPVTFPAYPQTSAAVRQKVAELRQRNGLGVDVQTRGFLSAQARVAVITRLRIAEIEI